MGVDAPSTFRMGAHALQDPDNDDQQSSTGPTASSRYRKLRWLRKLESVRFQLLIVALVLVDITLFFLESVDSVVAALSRTGLVVVQAVISFVFVVEILTKVYVYGWRRFTNVSTNAIDTFIVVVTTAGTVVELIELASSSSVKSVSDVSQGSTLVRVVRVFRLFRLFRIYRLYDVLTNMSRKRISSVAPVTPNARVVDILQRTKQCLMTSGEFEEYVRPTEIQWVLEVIRENRLGVAFMPRAEEKDIAFINQMGVTMPRPREGRHVSVTHIPVGSPDRLTLTWGQVLGDDAGAVDTLERVLEKTLATWEFDVFLVSKLSGGHPLRAVGFAVFRALQLGEFLNVGDDVVLFWLDAMEAGYPDDNPYHNSTHASDVLQSLYTLLVQLDLVGALGQLHVCALVVAAVVHDFGHPGVNNKFLVATQHELALRYNDISVLEANSLATAFQITERGVGNIFGGLDREDYDVVRRAVFSLVLKTDMAFHFDIIGAFEAQEQSGFDLLRAHDASVVMALLLHCADISNPAKPWDLSGKWTKAVSTEFRRQGKKELDAGLPLSKFMDPNAGPADEAQCQFLFVEIFVEPLFGVLLRFVEVTRPAHVAKIRAIFDCLSQNKRIHDQNRRGSMARGSTGSIPKLKTPRLSRASLRRQKKAVEGGDGADGRKSSRKGQGGGAGGMKQATPLAVFVDSGRKGVQRTQAEIDSLSAAKTIADELPQDKSGSPPPPRHDLDDPEAKDGAGDRLSGRLSDEQDRGGEDDVAGVAAQEGEDAGALAGEGVAEGGAEQEGEGEAEREGGGEAEGVAERGGVAEGEAGREGEEVEGKGEEVEREGGDEEGDKQEGNDPEASVGREAQQQE